MAFARFREAEAKTRSHGYNVIHLNIMDFYGFRDKILVPCIGVGQTNCRVLAYFVLQFVKVTI